MGQPPSGWPQPAAAPGATATGSGSPLGGVAAVLGGVLTVVGIFSAWIGAEGASETVKGWDLTSGDHFFKSSDPYLLLGLGLAAAAIGVVLFLGKARMLARIASVILGAVIIGICVKDWSDISDLVAKSSQFEGVTITTEFGFYLSIAGGVLAIIAAGLPAKKS